MCGEVEQCAVRCEHSGEQPRKNHDAGPENDRINNAHRQQQPEALLYAGAASGAVVIARNGLSALAYTLQRQQSQLHDAGHDGHGPDRDIPAVFQQRGIKADGDHAFAGLHDERGDAERKAGRKQPEPGKNILRFQAQHGLFSGEKRDDPYAGQALRDDGRKRGAAHAHTHGKNENRVKDNIGDRADQNGRHSGPCKALRGNEGVHPQRYLHKDRADGIDVHIRRRVGDGVSACSEQQKEILVPYQHDGGQHNRNAYLQSKTACERFLGRGMVASAHEYRCPGRSARADQGRKRGNDQNKRHTDPDAGQSKAACFRNMPDINTVNDVIQHIH